MMHPTQVSTRKLTVFLSSTFVDLNEVRAQIARWLTEVFDTDVIVMETFGSEAAPPDVNSVRRVRGCDLFVGIYAHRYGTVDPTSGKSVTELELDEAKRAYSSGTLRDLLLYIVAKDAPWRKEFRETTESAQAGLTRLKAKALEHTVTQFESAEELLIAVARDVYKRLSERFGIAGPSVRPQALPPKRSLSRPLGMEFVSSVDRDYLIGRERELEAVRKRLEEDCVVLLLGESGVGKTSLIHAGVIPSFVSEDWRCVYTRPLGLPSGDVANQLHLAVFDVPRAYRGPLVPLVVEVLAALGGQRLLLIVDQFEDVLLARELRETEELVTALRTLHERRIPELCLLVSYRADLEGRLGTYWQQVSGSARGLPRVYLSGIDALQAWDGVVRETEALSVTMDLTTAQSARIQDDLKAASAAAGFAGVYPPYIQMLVEHMWTSGKESNGPYKFGDYHSAGAMERIVGGYLTRQLTYAQDPQGHVRSVLIALVRSYGVKAQKTIAELCAETGLSAASCEPALEQLIDLRLVRPLDGAYEISHDFVAKKVLTELVDTEEQEFKRFRELLASKAAAYETTRGALTTEEILFLYKRRERLVPAEGEFRLLLASWVLGHGPALYWLLNADPTKLIDWLRSEETNPDLESEGRLAGVLLRRHFEGKPLSAADFAAFRSYRLSAEIAVLIRDEPLSVPDTLVMRGLSHRRDEVREACRAVLGLRIREGEWAWVERLRQSASMARREAYEWLVMEKSVPEPPESVASKSRSLREFGLLKRLARAECPEDLQHTFKEIRRFRPTGRSLLLAKAILWAKHRKIGTLVSTALQTARHKVEALFAPLHGDLPPTDFGTLLTTYEAWNRREGGPYETPAWHARANALSMAIRRCTSERVLAGLRKSFTACRLTSSCRFLALALVEHGNVSDLRILLRKIGAASYAIGFWNHTQLGRAAANRLKKTSKELPKFLQDLMKREEFWEYLGADARENLPKRALLPITNPDNRVLYVRVVGHAVSGAAQRTDKQLLLRLMRYPYALVRRAAASRLVELFGEEALRMMGSLIDQAVQDGWTDMLADTLRSGEMECYGLWPHTYD